MKAIYFLILFVIVLNRSLKERIGIILNNEEFLFQVKEVVNSIKSKNIPKIISTLSDTYLKTKNGTFPCFFYPCEYCKDIESYNKCRNSCWSGWFCDLECLDACEDYC